MTYLLRGSLKIDISDAIFSERLADDHENLGPLREEENLGLGVTRQDLHDLHHHSLNLRAPTA